MIDVFRSLKNLTEQDHIQVDNGIFRLHYRITVILLLFCSILLTSKQHFGEPIECDVESRENLINTFCWIFGTVVVDENFNHLHLPGLGMPSRRIGSELTNYRTFTKQSYYQWVCIVLFLQAMFFYVPRYLWKTWEGDRMKQLLEDLTGPRVGSAWNEDRKNDIVRHLANGGSTHNIYTVRYCFCESLNFINVLSQIFVMNWFVSGKFSSYGLAPSSYQHANPLNTIFPKMAKCTYFRYGASGSEEIRDALCILPLNVLNEKIFLVLWYWFFVLLFISACCVLYRAVFLFVPRLRMYLLRAFTRKLDNNRSMFIVKNLSFGNFFVLYRIGKNLNPDIYKELVMGLHDYIFAMGMYKTYPHTIDEA